MNFKSLSVFSACVLMGWASLVQAGPSTGDGGQLSAETKKARIKSQSSTQRSAAGRVAAEVVSATNRILTVHYDDDSGQFTIRTGANHPKPNKDVLYPIGTGYITLRDATDKIMWVNDTSSPSPGLAGYTTKLMTSETVVTTALANGNGFVTVYTLPNFEVTQEVRINGTTLNDTNVIHQVRVRNTTESPREFGLRYFWDWFIAGNDASLFRKRLPDGTFTSTFQTFDNPDFKLFEEVDRISNPTFSIFGSIRDLALDPVPTTPDQFRYCSWGRGVGSAWDFTNTGGGTDSATAYYWGFDTPIPLEGGAEKTFAQYATTQFEALGPPKISFKDPVLDISEAGTSASVFVERTGEVSLPASVRLTTSNGTATAPSDYTAVDRVVTLQVGERRRSVTIPIINDTDVEGDETIKLTLSEASGAELGEPKTSVLNIIDDDVAPVVPTISVDDPAISEGNDGTKTLDFTIFLSKASSSPITVNYSTSLGTATVGSDYVAIPNTTLTIPAGQTTKKVSVTLNGDTTVEPDETLRLNLSNATGATIDDAHGIGTILNDDSPPSVPTLSINDASISEGNSDTKILEFTISLSSPSNSPITVNYATANGTATAGSGDYVAAPVTTIRIPAGQTTKNVSVTIKGDTTFENNETFFVNLSNAIGAPIADGQGVGTILNDDTVPGAPTVSINNLSRAEGNDGTKVINFTVSLSAPSSSPVTVNYATSDGSATAGSDYVAIPTTTLVIPANETSQTVAVTINGETTFEGDETFFVNLSDATGAIIADGRGVGTILNDDTPSGNPTLSINNPSISEGNAGTKTLNFTVSLSATSASQVTASYKTSGGTATAVSDYVTADSAFTIPAGQTSKTISITIKGDTTFEGDETLLVNLSRPFGATIAEGEGVGTITNDDAKPTLSIDDIMVDEDAKNAVFTVTMNNPSDQEMTVNYATDDEAGTALREADYTATSGTLTIPAGQTSATIRVPVILDTERESDETFFVNLSNESGATIADGKAKATIHDVLTRFKVSGKVFRFRPDGSHRLRSERLPFEGITVKMGDLTAVTNSNGEYTFSGVSKGTYLATPQPTGDQNQFSPSSQSVRVAGADVTGFNFSALMIVGRVYKTNSKGTRSGLANAEIKLNGTVVTTTDADGFYAIKGIGNGQYTVRPALEGWSFASKTVTLRTSGISNLSPNGLAKFEGTRVPVPSVKDSSRKY